jgi:phage terminase Nu1 subunit (DNA packaging protein)
MSKIIGQKKLADIVGLTKMAIYLWTQKGLPYTRDGLDYVFNPSEVASWLRERNARYYEPLIETLENYEG